MDSPFLLRSIAAIEILKDQGAARWNYRLKCVNQLVKNNIRSYSQLLKQRICLLVFQIKLKMKNESNLMNNHLGKLCT
ncbi:hypothetical protein RDABS01_032321 [Bienertia sinuspersici]